MILYQNKIIITPPKCGTFTINSIFDDLGGSILFDDTDYNTMHRCDHSSLPVDDKEVWMIVRNPYDKLVSSYFYWTKQDEASTNSKENVESIWHWNTRGKFLEDTMSFLDFVLWYDQERQQYKDLLLTKTDHPLIPFYVRSLSEGYEVANATHFLRLEHLAKDLQKMGVYITNTPHYNQTKKRTNKHFESMFTPEILNIVNKWCIPDAKKFGYNILK